MSGYIPIELIKNILARLPSKDVLRCTSVCKSWYALVISSSFTSLHLKLSTPNRTHRLLIQYNSCSTYTHHYSLLVQNQALSEISGRNDSCYIIGSFNGLFLLHAYYTDTAMLWNPSLRKTLILPKPMDYWHTLGFGFLPATNDYKIVNFSQVKGQIYELSTGSWRDINADNIPFLAYTNARQAFFKGIVHWPARSQTRLENPERSFIGSFNMKNESFGTLMVPSSLRGSDFSLSTFQESLCLFIAYENCCTVWVMKEYGVTDSWVEQFNIDIGCRVRSIVYLKENSEMLLETFKDATWADFVLYDSIDNKVIKNIHHSSERAYGFIAHSYMESLVLIKGPIK